MLSSFVHRIIPPANGGPAPALLLLHGTGGNESDLVDVGRLLDARAALLGIRGKVLENGLPRFFRRLAEGVFDEKDLVFRAAELRDFLQAAVREYRLGPLVAVGYSNGANMAAALLLLHPGLLAGAILFHAMLPLIPAQPPDLAGRPVFLTAGRHDPLVPRESVEQLARLLKEAGARPDLYWCDGGHGLAPEEVAAARQWLRREMPGT